MKAHAHDPMTRKQTRPGSSHRCTVGRATMILVFTALGCSAHRPPHVRGQPRDAAEGIAAQPSVSAPEQPSTPAVEQPSTPAVVDGIVVWNRRLEEAPPEVQQRVELVLFAIEMFASAPRPPVDWDADPEAWRRSLEASAPHFREYEQKVQAWLKTPGDYAAAVASLSPEEVRLYTTLIQLIEEYQRARYLSELRIGKPAFGSCYNAPDETFGDALSDTLELAERCIALSAGVSGPLGSNTDECQRRADWSRRLIATGEEGVCEAPSWP
jgi:hypothetical protein